jgi:hypothetical protein
VALIRDKTDIQPLLLQAIVGNEATFLVKKIPLNVHLASQKSAWNNLGLMARIFTILALTLRRHLAESQPILLLDASWHIDMRFSTGA